MRKLLMASAAILGASGGVALAQTSPAPANPTQGQLAAPYGAGPAANNNNNAWGIANTPTGSAAAGPLSTQYAPNVDAVPAPGTIVIRLNGRLEAGVSFAYSAANTGQGTTGTTATGVSGSATGAVIGSQTANPTGTGYKLNPVGVYSYFRLYPGFDGLAANGVRYGASAEFRENFYQATNGSVNSTVSATGGQPSGTGTAASSPSGQSSAQTVFVRRAFTYIAMDQVGILRVGQADGVLGLFDNCIFTTQCFDAGQGNFNGGGMTDTLPTNATPPFVWLTQAGAEYDSLKLVYLSPQFFGFDIGLQYAPSMGNALQDTAGPDPLEGGVCPQAGQNCVATTSGNDPTRWFNLVGGGVRFQQTFGPVDFKAFGYYGTAGKEMLTTTTYLSANTGGTFSNTATNRIRYDNLSYYTGGIAITAFNVTAAADYIGGAINGQLSMRPTGGAPTNAVVTGLTYANGPITAGAEIGLIDTQGSANLVGLSQRHEYEVAFGGAYKVAPGLQLAAEYMYQHRHQGDLNFYTSVAGSGTRDIQAQGVLLSTVLTW